ncbi:hypothetical protein HMPREF1624_03825 [Sporothrix schenckii ATCC 58251]|uniref:Ornithine decarboxylase antizyme n=1 Tax=Sporothrix schenckii (strain ATCC 58251 / de Perez 2211183) TaxID=1391915 RepID=U7PZW5_SPOS1|nr:hypothetical protein HMPREF1624_03825 [Sporothrix schenckii ATCC 58251]
MAQLQSNLNNSSSSRYGEGAVRQADVLASCYVIDAAATQLKGLHYCTTPLAGLPSPPSSPPLAAISATNELTVFPKNKASAHTTSRGGHARPSGRGGATLRIREECERLFCETMKTVFLGERNMASTGSSLTGVYGGVPPSAYHSSSSSSNGGAAHYDYIDNVHNDDGDDDRKPPAEDGPGSLGRRRTSSVSEGGRSYSFGSSVGARSISTVASSVDGDGDGDGDVAPPYAVPAAWLELWDFVGCGSFRGFVAEDPAGATSLFAFFDASVLSRDLKRALMALIELADTALHCAHLVICVDRGGAEALPDEAATLLKGLQWAGFSLTTLDTWTGGACVDVTSARWIFMGMEL